VSDLFYDAEADLERAEALIDLGRYGEALPLAARAVERKPDRFWAWCLLTQAHLGLHRGQSAVDCGKRAVSLAPDKATAHHLLSYAWEAQGSKSEATREAREAVRLAPDGWPYWVRLAERLTRDNARNNGIDWGWQEVRQAADQARRLGPLEAETHLAVANVEAAAGDWGAARAAYLKALERASCRIRLANGRGRRPVRAPSSAPGLRLSMRPASQRNWPRRYTYSTRSEPTCWIMPGSMGSLR
jgi:tetratricopeptide (TPR) repeat protein